MSGKYSKTPQVRLTAETYKLLKIASAIRELSICELTDIIIRNECQAIIKEGLENELQSLTR
jgi:hypothetical protein